MSFIVRYQPKGMVMAILYKYMHMEHAKSLIENGTVRIGTLYEYRNTEKHGTTIGDDLEGTKSVYMDVKKEWWTGKSQPEFAKSFFNLSENSSMRLEGITLEKPTNSLNYYIYCTTEEFDKDVQSDFSYDACIIIENPKKFFAVISEKLKRKALFKGIYKCQYRDRRIPHDKDNKIHPAIIKDPKDSKYKEVRAIWKPEKKLITPIVINCRGIIRYCKLLK